MFLMHFFTRIITKNTVKRIFLILIKTEKILKNDKKMVTNRCDNSISPIAIFCQKIKTPIPLKLNKSRGLSNFRGNNSVFLLRINLQILLTKVVKK